MLIKAPAGQWCDYCGLKWGKDHVNGQRQAVWQTITKRGSNVIRRSYCYSCAMEVQTRHDGTIWPLKDQIEYAKQKERLDVQFE